MFPLLLASLVVLPAALGLPLQRATATWCEGLGIATIDTTSQFTLSAFNVTNATLPPFNQVGEPLVIGTTQELSAYSIGVLATTSSYSENNFPTYNLSSGALLPFSSVSVYTTDAEDNGVPTFSWTSDQDELDPAAQIFCAVINTDPEQGGNPNPQLAIDQDLDDFSLCVNELGFTQVVHSPTANTTVFPSYSVDSCYPVTIHLMGIVSDD